MQERRVDADRGEEPAQIADRGAHPGRAGWPVMLMTPPRPCTTMS